MNEETIVLIRECKEGNREAAQQLVVENSGLIWSVVKHFYGRGVDADDLYQLGCVGFLKAIQGFDENFGTQFSTYAVPKISGEIRRFLRDDGAVKVSRGVKERAQLIRNARNTMEQRLGREPTINELSEETGITPEDIAVAETATGPAESLQRESGDENFSLEDVLGDYGQEERLIERVALTEAINTLPEKERMIIALRFYRGMTQDASAKVLGISQVQVSRLERKAILALRELLLCADT